MMSTTKSRHLGYHFGISLKDLMWYHIHAKRRSQDLTSLGFMMG